MVAKIVKTYDWNNKEDVECLLSQVKAMIESGQRTGWRQPEDLQQLINHREYVKERLSELKGE